MRGRENLRIKRKKIGRFLKKAWQKLSDASRLREKYSEQNSSKAIIITYLLSILSKEIQPTRTVNVLPKSPHKEKAVIKLQSGQAPVRLPGVQGGGSPLAHKTHIFSLFSQKISHSHIAKSEFL